MLRVKILLLCDLARVGIESMMVSRHERMFNSESLRKALDDVGAEPLAGSGFEDETPDPEFSETALIVPELLR